MKYIASLSGGKDSTAMLLLLLEKDKYPLDAVVFCDTTMEYQAVYKVIDKLEVLCQARGVEFYKVKYEFEELAFRHKINTRDGSFKQGYGWCGANARWGTTKKKQVITQFYKEHYPGELIVEYVGIALDEQKRLDHLGKTVKIYPLAEWGMTEKDCLEYCKNKGYYWTENGVDLYKILDRVSCWCCLNKNLKELRNIREYLPEYWQKLKNYELQCGKPYRQGLEDLEKRFEKEGRQLEIK